MSEAVVGAVAGLLGVFVGGALNWRVQSALEDRRERAKREEEGRRRRLDAAGALRALRVELAAMHEQLTDIDDARKTALSRGGGPPEWGRRLQGFAAPNAWRTAGPAAANVLADEDWLSLADAYAQSEALRRTVDRGPSGLPEQDLYRGAFLVDSLLEVAASDIELIDRLLPELLGNRPRSGLQTAKELPR